MITSYDADVLLYSTVGPPVTAETLRVCGAGGSELELVQVATALARRGHRVTLALRGLNDDECKVEDGVTYTTTSKVPKHVRALYLQRWTKLPPNVFADRVIVRCNDHCDARDYDVHNRLLSSGGATLVCNTNWQATLFPFAAKKAVIAPIVEAPPMVEKKLGQFVYASAARKGLLDTIRYWHFFMSRLDEVSPGSRETMGLKLMVAVPEYSGGVPELPEDQLEAIGVHLVPTPRIEDYRRLIAESEGLFYVIRFSEVFCCVAALAELAQTRPHILCLRGVGGIREALSNSRLVTTDPEQFSRDFLHALSEPENDWVAAPDQIVDRSPDTIAKQWEEVLGL